MCSHIPRNILLPLTKTWNTYSPGCCGSYLPQVHPTGLGTTLCCIGSAIFKCCIGPGRGWDKEGQRKEEMKSRRKSSPYMTESTEINCRQRLKEVGINNEDKELMDEGNNVRYLRIN
jgi:hypothetical protein